MAPFSRVNAADGFQKFAANDAFCNISLRSCFQRALYVDVPFVGTQDDDACAWKLIPDFLDYVETAHVGQLQIHESHVMSGFDVIKKIRNKFPSARIIVLSSHEGDVDIQRALEAGAQGYVAKGIVRGELLETIRSVHAGKHRLPAALPHKIPRHLVDHAF